MKLVGKVVLFLLMLVAFKYSFDSYTTESIIATFGSFAVGMATLTGFIMLLMEEEQKQELA